MNSQGTSDRISFGYNAVYISYGNGWDMPIYGASSGWSKIRLRNDTLPESKDTICTPVTVVKNLLIAARQRDVLSEKINLLIKDTSLLAQRIVTKDRQLYLLNAENENNIGMLRAKDEQLEINERQKQVLKEQLNSYERLVRKEKTKRFFATAGGLLTSGILTFLLIKK